MLAFNDEQNDVNMYQNEEPEKDPAQQGRLLEFGMIAFVVAAAVSFLGDAWNPDVDAAVAAVRHFSQGVLDHGCSETGTVVDRGFPCADDSGFRFALRGNGQYVLYALDNGVPERVFGSDSPGTWTGSSEQLDRLERRFTATGYE